MILDLAEKLHAKRIEENQIRNDRYVVRNEMVKFLDILTRFDLRKLEMLGMKEKLLDDICKLNTKIAGDVKND